MIIVGKPRAFQYDTSISTGRKQKEKKGTLGETEGIDIKRRKHVKSPERFIEKRIKHIKDL